MGTVDTPKERVIARAQALHVDTGLADVVDGLPLVLPMLPRRAMLESKVITQLTHVAARVRETRKRLRGQGEAGAGAGFGDRAGRPVLHQVTQTMRPFDAVSNDTLAIQNLLRTNGFFSEIFAEHVDPSLRDRVRSVDQLSDPAVDRDAVLVHVCVHAPRLMRILEQRSGLLHLRFHSNTPPEWFAGVSIGFEQSSRKGWAEMTRLSRIAKSAIADSAHNVREITEVGMRDVTLVPILLEPADLVGVPAVATGNYAVSVGRIAPNKRIDFALRTIAAYQRTYDPDFGLVLVGSDRGLERYGAACHVLALSLGVCNLTWTGSVTEAEKLRLMRAAAAYLCTSDHEGFCVPIVESFRLGLPVVARATSAVTDTCGDALAVDTADPSLLADVLRVVVTDAGLRDQLVAVQSEEAKRFDPVVVGEQVLAWARTHVAGA